MSAHAVRNRLSTLIEDLRVKASTVVDDGAMTVYNHDQFVASMDSFTLPAVAITFIARSTNRGAGKESVQGIGADVRLGIYVMGDTLPCKGQDGAPKMASVLDVLDDLKSAITGTNSTNPVGHKWKYITDVPANLRQGGTVLMGYMQVWETVQT